jgi:triosephosphate isomerase
MQYSRFERVVWYNMLMRTKIIVGNWKMNTSLAEAYALAEGVLRGTEHIERITTVICPPSIWLTTLAHDVIPKGRLPHLKMGAQNMHPEEHGAFTGEVSPTMLQDIVEYVIVGHSERTHLFHEDTDFIADKVMSAFDHGLTPVLCVGEDEQSSRSATQVVQTLNHLIKELSKDQIEKLVVAYEPVWAIGTGKAATPEYAEKVLTALRSVVSPMTRLIYGGSSNEENAKGFLELPDCDGLLPGGASLKLKSFLTMCQIADDLAQAAGYRSLHS